MIYYTTLKERCEVHNEKTIKRNQKTCIIGNVYGNWSDSSVYNRSNPTDWQYAASNAYTGIILRLGLWVAVWNDGRFYSSVAALSVIWHAANLSDWCFHDF